MIQTAPQMRILVGREPIDFRKGIEGTAAVCRTVLQEDPMGGKLFVFRNRARNMIRLLAYDGQGFWLMTKRLSTGRFRHWLKDGDELAETLDAPRLQVLLAAGDWTQVSPAEYWRRVA
jgi:transposase